MATEELIGRLRYESEGESLDFKAEQYRFVGGTLEDKAELLKDVLAFANSWKRNDAYILIGVRETKGGPAEVVGISSHLDDADLQQFVNGKTQRPIRFSYRELQIDGKTIAVLHVPLQERPFFLTARYGKLDPNVVYVRRGSSTAPAKPDEVARMGREEAGAGAVLLDLFFADPRKRARIEPKLTSHVLEVPEPSDIPDFRIRRAGPVASVMGRQAYPNYYKKLARFTKVTRLVSPLWLAVSNRGEEVALDVRLEISITGADDGVLALDEYDYPDVPQKEYDLLSMQTPRAVTHFNADVHVKRVAESWLVSARTEKVQAKSTEWFSSPFYLGAESSRDLEARALLFADNLTAPHEQTLTIPVDATPESVTLDRILELEEERFVNSPAHRAFLKELEEGSLG